MAVPAVGSILGRDQFERREITPNGYCMYASFNTAMGTSSTDTIEAKRKNQLLACIVAEKLRVIGGEPIDRLPVWNGVTESQTTMMAYPLETLADVSADYVVYAGQKRTFVLTPEEYINALKTDDPIWGLQAWPDLTSRIGIAVASINPNIGWIVTTDVSGGYKVEATSVAQAEAYALPEPSPRYFVVLVHTGGNHYEVLLPAAGNADTKYRIPAGEHLFKRWEDISSCAFTLPNSVVGVYAIWNNHLLLHKRADALFGPPGGSLDITDKSPAVGARREFREETGGEIDLPDEAVPFHEYVDAGRRFLFYRIDVSGATAPQIPGPTGTYANEIQEFTAADMTLLGGEGVSAGGKHMWIPLYVVKRVVTANPEQFVNRLGELLRYVGATVTLEDIATASDILRLAAEAYASLKASPAPRVSPETLKVAQTKVAAAQTGVLGAVGRMFGISPKAEAAPTVDTSALQEQINTLKAQVAALRARTVAPQPTPAPAPRLTPMPMALADETQAVLDRIPITLKYTYPNHVPNVQTIPVPGSTVNMDKVLGIEEPVPAWAASAVKQEDVPEECHGVSFYTPHCRAASMYRDVLVADAAKKDNMMYGDPMMATYADLQKQIAEETDAATRASLERKREALFPKFKDLDVLVPGKGVEKVPIANPYVAYDVRQAVSSFVNPPPISTIQVLDPSGEMIQANVQALKRVALPEMLADKELSIALLESLWHCGTRPGAGGPRCHPLQVLAEIREYNAAKAQLAAAKGTEGKMGTLVPAQMLKHGWPLMQEILQWLRNAGIDATISRVPSSYTQIEPAATTAPAAMPPVVAAAPIKPVTHGVFHITTGGAIVPHVLGNTNLLHGIPQYIPRVVGLVH